MKPSQRRGQRWGRRDGERGKRRASTNARFFQDEDRWYVRAGRGRPKLPPLPSVLDFVDAAYTKALAKNTTWPPNDNPFSRLALGSRWREADLPGPGRPPGNTGKSPVIRP